MLLHHIITILVTAVGVMVAARIVPGVRVRSIGSALVFAFVLAVLNAILKTALVVLAFPFILITLGLFMLIINAFLFWLADKVVKGVEVDGFGAVILGSLVTSAVSWGCMYLLHHL